MLKFCTLFNTTYLSRGLAMYHSLEQNCPDFHLYIFAFDAHCYEVLSNMTLPKVSVISLEEFENEALLAVKPGRTAQEYCWTSASSTIKYCIETFNLDHCTYVDADLLFFSNPQILMDGMAEKSVLITEHRYTPCYDQSVKSGIYCVQYMTFKNTEEGMEVLNYWVDSCLEWCFNRFEDGKFGDQKYLDNWTEQFSCVQVCAHLGAGVAPWNIQQYNFKSKSGKPRGVELASGQEFDLVFYHYHGFSYSVKNSYMLTHAVYQLSRNQIKQIYRPYVAALSIAERRINTTDRNLIPHEINNEMELITRVLGRFLIFSLLGYYKNLYTKRSFQYSFIY